MPTRSGSSAPSTIREPPIRTYVGAMIRLVERLLENGIAYEAGGSIYFRVTDFPGYGQLSGAAASDRLAGARVDSDEYDKEDAQDFVLWKGPRPGEPVLGRAVRPRARPGWHLECSAMGLELLGSGFDLHCGGVDLVFPHHENEIAQSEAATGETFVRHWFHCEHLLVDGRKMSKSLGNQFTVRELLDEGFAPAAIRHLLASVHYRQQLNFTKAGLRQAEVAIGRGGRLPAALRRGRPMVRQVPGTMPCLRPRPPRALVRFEEALDDDLNTSKALAEVFIALKEGNRALHSPGGAAEAAGWAAAIRRMNSVLGSFEMGSGQEAAGDAEEPPDLGALIRERQVARERRDFARADEIRDGLAARGILLEDSPSGTIWRRRGD